MTRQKKITIQFILIAVFLGIAWYRLYGSRTSPYELEFFSFDTTCRITIWGEPDHKAQQAAREIFNRCNDLNRCFNRFDPGSELSQFNLLNASVSFQCSDDFLEITRYAINESALTAGSFDASVLPLIHLWKKCATEKRAPTGQELSEARMCCGMEHLVLHESAGTPPSIEKDTDGFSLDFGGLAKGYALEKSRGILDSHGIRRYLLDFGGNICCSRMPPPRHRTFTIGIRNPSDRASTSRHVQVLGCAVSTSGNYERGTALPHIFDPHTGAACDSLKAVTVITPSCVDSDAFSTAVFVGGEELARRLAGTIPQTSFIITRADDTEITISATKN